MRLTAHRQSPGDRLDLMDVPMRGNVPMSVNGINQQVLAYDLWRKVLAQEIARYLKWLKINQLCSVEMEEELARKQQSLLTDSLTLAFVGEFSRGKTEFINALFFTEFGQRMLPSQAGRTTMCPVELFHDPQGSSYLRLLPIETRASDRPLSDFRTRIEDWVTTPIDMNHPQDLRLALEQIARIRSVTYTEARRLGFDAGTLETDREHPGHVLIPAWRLALISLDHPVLRQGLRILDTPGLNSLGAEPELTFSMLPTANAIVFMLGADTGVTASDMEIWTRHLVSRDRDQRTIRFAVLNKIDTLRDDLVPANQTAAMIEDLRSRTAAQLGLEPSAVLALSARDALIGRIRNDTDLLESSRIGGLEDLISERLLARKEKHLTDNLVMDVLGMVRTSQTILQSRHDSLRERLDLLEQKGMPTDSLKELSDRTQEEHNYYNKKLFTLRSSRRLMKSQATILAQLVNAERFEDHALQTRESLVKSWTTAGMGRAISDFFNRIDTDLNNVRHEGRLAQKMVDSIYQRYNPPDSTNPLKPAPLAIGSQLKALETLRGQAEKFKMEFSTLFSEQTVVVNRFFNTLVAEARRLYLEISEECQRWPQDALLPLLQDSLQQKQSLEHQIRRLRDLSATARDALMQKRKLEGMLEEIQRQMQIAATINRRIRRPAPQLLKQRVINLPGVAR